MAISPRALAALVALTLLPLGGFLLLGGKDADAQGTPVVASPNVSLVGAVPGTSAISGVFSRSAPFFYVSGLDSLTVLDVSDPKFPKPVGKLVNAIFQNEAMTLGERVGPDGKVQRFVLVGNDLAQVSVSPDGVQRGRVNGKQLIVVDVTDPRNPKIVGQTPSTGKDAITTSTHTVACMNPSCSIAYSAGGDFPDNTKFSIIDLTDITKPREVKSVSSPGIFANPVFTSPSGHHWNVDGEGLAWQAGAGGTAVFDITDPLNPTLVNGTDANGRKSPYNDFIHHNTQRPNARAFKPGKDLGVQNGNVVLIGEEDYANDGDEVDCAKAGTFQTWEIPDLDAEAYKARNPKGEPDKGTVRVLDTINPPAEAGPGQGATTPAGAFCSVHWFDFHPAGIVAIGNYQQGLRLVDVRNPRDLKNFGFFTGGASEVWDAYWAPQRDATGAIVPGRKTNLVYTVDAVQGVGVFQVSNMPPDLPVTGDDGSRGTFPSRPGNVAEDNAKLGSGGSSQGGGAGSAGQTGPRYVCVSRRQVTITMFQAKKSRLRSVRVTVNGKRHRAQLRGRKSVRVSLARKLKGRYKVRITGVTSNGKRVSTTRYYRTCTPKGTPLPSGAPKSKIKKP
jgi:hypothetical protein